MNTERNARGSRRFVPSPSMLVALLALAVAMSGTAYAAATINGKNIKKGTVSSKQIKNSTITSSDIKNGTISGKDVKSATITADKIAAGVIPTVPGPAPIGIASNDNDFAVQGLLGDPNVTGMTVNYTVPAGANKVVAQFSAACSLSSTADAQSIIVRVRIDGQALGTNDYASFCSPGDEDGTANSGSGGDTVNTGGSLIRAGAASPGTHTIQVQALQGLVSPGTLDSMSLVVTSGS